MGEAELTSWVEQVKQGVLARRSFLQRVVALGVSVPLANAMLASAGVAQTPAASVYKPTRRGGGGVLRLLFWQGPTSMNPHFASGTKDMDGASLFYESLVRYDEDGQLTPLLAAEIPSRENGGIARDGLSTVWKLKKGVSWHDGQPFTADDVVFNWQYATHPAAATYTLGLYAGIKAVEKIDSHMVRVVFARATPLWHQGSNAPLVPRHLFAAYQGEKSREAPNNLRPVGTGPYRFVEFKPGDSVKGVLNQTYHLPNRPHFDSVEIKGGGDATSAARAVLQTGEFDFGWNLQVEDDVLRRIEAGGKGQIHYAFGGDTEFVLLNASDPWTETDGERGHPRSRHPVFSDPAVRQAMLLLADRPGMQEFVYGRAGVATPNILNNPARYNSNALKLDSSADKANAVLDAAGWKRGADGIRAKDGRKLRFVYQTSTNSLRQKVQSIYKQACAKAGVELELKSVNGAVFFSSDAGNPDTLGKFWADMQMFTFTRGPDPDRYMQLFVSWEASSKANKWMGLNASRWSNAEYDKLHRATEVELDPVKRAAQFIRMNDIVCSAGHVIPLVTRANVSGHKRGLVAPISPWDTSLGNIHDWYREA